MILNWKFNQIYAHCDYFPLLLQHYRPATITLQETNLRSFENFSIKNYVLFINVKLKIFTNNRSLMN